MLVDHNDYIDRSVIDPSITLARHLGVFDEWEMRLETWCFMYFPEIFENKAMIIRQATRAREASRRVQTPIDEETPHSILMSGVTESEYDTIRSYIFQNMDDWSDYSREYNFREMCYRLAKDERITNFIHECREREALEEVDPYMLESWLGYGDRGYLDAENDGDYLEEDNSVNDGTPQDLEAWLRLVVDEWGGIEEVCKPVSESIQNQYERILDNLETDYRKVMNGAENISPLSRQVLVSKDFDPRKIFSAFYHKAENGSYAAVPCIPDWAIDRYFEGNEEMKETFGKYRDILAEEYKEKEDKFIQDVVDRNKEMIKSDNLEIKKNDYFFFVTYKDDNSGNLPIY